MLDTFREDLRYGIRKLVASPGFTLVAVLSLGLGIGVNTTIFSLVNAVLLRPLPVEEPERLVEVYTSDSDGYAYATSSYPDYRDLREGTELLEGLLAHQLTILNHQRERGRAEMLFGEAVTGNYFELLGVPAAVGRPLRPADDRPGSRPAVVLGHGFWQREFEGDPDVVGEPIELNGTSFTVVGVAPEWFTGTYPVFAPDVWTPMTTQRLISEAGPDPEILERRGRRNLFLKGRLKPGVTVEQAEDELDAVMARLGEVYPRTNADRSVSAVSLDDVRIHPFIDGAIAPVATLLMGLVGLVLLIACANVANMLLARAAARRREIGVRLALGASRWRLVRQLVTESSILGISGGVVGLLFAYWTQDLLLALQPPIPVSVAIDLGIDVRVFAFALAAGVVTGLLFGLVPALRASDPGSATVLSDSGALDAGGARRFDLRDLLVAGQVAVSLVLLVAASLFVRSLLSAQEVDLGFDPQGVALVAPALELLGYEETEILTFQDRLVRRVSALPGVESVARADSVPLGLGFQSRQFRVEGVTPPGDRDVVGIDVKSVGPAFFETLRIPLLRGRTFDETDRRGAPPAAVVTEAMAREFWPDEGAVGKRIRSGGDEAPWIEIVGVVADHKVRTVGEDPRPLVYLSLLQEEPTFTTFLVRSAGNAGETVEAVRREVLALEPDAVFLEAATMSERTALTLFPVRMGALLLGIFGALALALAGIGLYGVVSYAVSRRRREIGLRMALGADGRDVHRLVLRQGMTVVVVGAIVGLALAATMTWSLSSFLYGISAFDPVAFGSGALVLTAAALIANLLPARRATRLDPLIALRAE